MYFENELKTDNSADKFLNFRFVSLLESYVVPEHTARAFEYVYITIFKYTINMHVTHDIIDVRITCIKYILNTSYWSIYTVKKKDYEKKFISDQPPRECSHYFVSLSHKAHCTYEHIRAD